MRNFPLDRRLIFLFVLGFLLALPKATRAQTAHRLPDGEAGVPANGDGMDTHLFRPAVDSKGFFTVNGSDILGAKDISFGLVNDYGHNIMRLEDGHGDSALVKHSFQGTFSFNYGIANQLVAGISIPLNLLYGDEVQNVGPAGALYSTQKLNTQAFSFIGLHLKYRLARVERGIGVALLGQVGFAGSSSALKDLGRDAAFFWPHAVFEKRFGATGALKLGLDLGFRLHTQSNPKFDQIQGGPHFENDNLLTGGFGAAYRILDAVDLVAETYATQLVGGSSDGPLKLSDEVVGGVKVFVERNSYFMLGGGIRTTQGFEAADQRAFIGFIFEPSIGDRDGDGYKDDVDKCPDEPEDFDGFQDADGCPDPDNDNDGILDVDDKCPNNPENMNGVEDHDGCPEGVDGDRDGDGIPDSKDKCPDQPEDRDGFQDADGCPDPDNDKDGIPDKKDQCPNDPEDRDGFQDVDGCPDPDNDRDQIPDVKDKCPNDPETYNGFQDADGCPDKGNVIIQDNNILILQKVMFKTGSAEILPESNAILDAVGTTVVHHPEFTLIEVQGHADERSGDEYNLRLTKDRAHAVVEALVQRGVVRDRLQSMGYGEYCPLDPAHNADAWEKNRRVEFKVVKTIDGPTGVELGCANARTKGVFSPTAK
jgi:outer membrane protein OmpA-like peptidoglycan-associated protein